LTPDDRFFAGFKSDQLQTRNLHFNIGAGKKSQVRHGGLKRKPRCGTLKNQPPFCNRNTHIGTSLPADHARSQQAAALTLALRDLWKRPWSCHTLRVWLVSAAQRYAGEVGHEAALERCNSSSASGTQGALSSCPTRSVGGQCRSPREPWPALPESELLGMSASPSCCLGERVPA